MQAVIDKKAQQEKEAAQKKLDQQNRTINVDTLGEYQSQMIANENLTAFDEIDDEG